MKKALLILFSPSLLFISCCKKKEKEWQTFGPFYLGQLASYVCFKPGTMWIYKNPATSELDTVLVTNSGRKIDTIIDETERQKIIRETFYTFFTYSKTGISGSFKDFSYQYAGRGDLGYLHKIDFGKLKSATDPGSSVAMFYPFDKSKNPTDIIPGFEFTILENTDTSVVVFGRPFDSVQVFRVTLDDTWNSMPVLYYWAPEYGIVYRKDLNNGEEWYLESETIIQ